MFDIFKSKETLRKEILEEQALIEAAKKEDEQRVLAAEEAAKAKAYENMTDKEKASFNKIPYVSVIRAVTDASDPKHGTFDLDWNELFIVELRTNGYQGATDEAIVDNWFTDVCRHVVYETYEQEAAQQAGAPYVETTTRRDGKSEIK